MTPDDALALVKQLAPIAKAEGIRKVKVGGLEIEFGAAPMDAKQLEEMFSKFVGPYPSDTEVRDWSAPGGFEEPAPPEPPPPKNVRRPLSANLKPAKGPRAA